MTRILVIFLSIIPLAGLCQSPAAVSMAGAPGNVVPGGHFTLFFDVKTTAPSSPDSLRESIILPEKWRLLSRRMPGSAANQTSFRYIYVIGTPADCRSGNYVVDFHIDITGRQVSLPVTVPVEQVRKMEVFAVAPPEFVREGDTLKLSYLIRNSGNNPEKFVLKSERGTVDAGPDSISLEAGTGMTVVVSQVIPFTDNNAWQATSNLTLATTGPEQPVYAAASIPVFSSRARKIDPYFRFPVEIGGGYLFYRYNGQDVAAWQYNATGGGFLDQKERHYADFTVRGPNRFMFPAMGSYDQYSFGYIYRKRLFVSAGDYALQLNNLMEFGRFGRGVRLEQQFSKLAYTVFYQKARFYQNQKDSYGGKLTFKINESAGLGVHYMSKNVLFHKDQFWSHLVGVSANVRTKALQLETELANGRAEGKSDFGGFLKLQTGGKWLNFTSNLIYAGKHFYGFYNNSRLINNNLSFNLTKKVTLGVSNNFSDVNPSLDATLYSVSPKDRSYTAFLSYQANYRNRFFVFYSTVARKDRQQPAQFDYSEDFGNLSYYNTSEKFSLVYQGRYGYSRNHLVPDDSGKKRSVSNMVQPAVRVAPWIWLGGYFEYQHTSKFSASNDVQDLFFYGGNARINIKKQFYASFLYRNNYAPDELYTKRSFLDVSAVLDLKRHLFTISGGRSHVPGINSRDQNTLFFGVRYALRLNVPLSRKRNIGHVRGKLTGFGFPKQGNLIQLGSHKFMTDSTGMFSFEGLAPDRYYLCITQNASGSDGVVPVVKMPMLVDVRPDSVRVVDIPMTRTGAITGRIDFIKAGPQGVSSVLTEKPVVLVKLASEYGSYLTEPNAKGEFSFREMRPGNWEISAFIPGSQDRFVVEDSRRELALETDKTIELVFRIRPNEKRIHFSERNFEVSVKK